MEIASRHHLRSDAVTDLENTLEENFGITLDGDTYELVELDESIFDLVLVDTQPWACYITDEPAPTVKGANAHSPDKRVVTIDTGAISFVSDGADVMRPGIVEADSDIDSDDLVLVAEESHGKVLAIGRSRVAGPDLLGEEGKVIDSLHHVGDDLFAFDI